MSEVINLGAELSSNPKTKVVAHVQGLDGRVNATETGKLFYVGKCLVINGAKPETKSVTIWANNNGQFDLSVVQYNKYMKDKVSEGRLVRFDGDNGLLPYEVEGNIFDYATLLVMDGESESAMVTSFNKRQSRVRLAAPTTGEDLGGSDDEDDEEEEEITKEPVAKKSKKTS